jgi:hypothetical protein
MVQTLELINWLGDMAAQALRSFADGAQAMDAPDFLDEALAAPKAISGFAPNAKAEAQDVTVKEINEAWLVQEQKLTNAGAHPLAAATIINGLKTSHLGFAWAVQSAIDKTKVQVVG